MLTSDMIRQLCQYKGVSITELCRRIEQSPQNFGKKLKRDTVSLGELGQIAQALGVKYEQRFVIDESDFIGISYENNESGYSLSDKVISHTMGTRLLEVFIEAVYYVDLDAGTYTVRYRKEWLDKKYNRDGDFVGKVVEWINADVDAADREMMIYEVRPDTIKARLKEVDNYSVMYKSIHTNPPRHQEMCVIRGDSNEDARYITLCFIDRDEYVRNTQESEKIKNDYSQIVSAAEAVFSMCVHCNLTKNKYHFIENDRFHVKRGEPYGEFDKFIMDGLYTLPSVEYHDLILSNFSLEALKKAHADGKTNVELTYPQIGDDGVIRYISTCFVFVEDESGDLLAIAFSRDVSDEKEREKKATRTQELINTVVQSCISVYEVNLDTDTYEVLHMNRVVKEQFDAEFLKYYADKNYTDAINTFVDIRVHPDYQEKMYKEFAIETIKDTLLRTDNYTRTYRESGPDNPYFEMRVQKLNGKYGENAVLISFFNIDEETKKHISEGEKLAKALETAEKAVRAKQEFLFNMSRDLKTPMNVIVGLTEMAMRNQDNPLKLQNYLSKMRMAEDSLMQLLNDVLLMSQLSTDTNVINEKKVSIPDEAMNIISSVKDSIISKKIHFNFLNKTLKDKEVYADSMLVNRAMMAIFENAVKFTPPGGTIVHTIEQLEDGEDQKGRYVFSIEDNGIGISEQFIANIFQPFTRENRVIERNIPGIGMGLCITNTLVDLMGGRIEVESKENLGSTFRVYLSFNKIDIDQYRNPVVERVDNVAGKSILVVEDNELNREIAKDILESYDMNVVEAINGNEALEYMSMRDGGNIDVILMDTQMPVMNGYETVKHIRNLKNPKSKNVPIVALTSNSFENGRELCARAGMDAYVEKPIIAETLITTISALLK